MTPAAARHRDLDRRFLSGLGEPGHQRALLPPRQRLKDMHTMSAPRVPLTMLSVRASAKGNAYLAGRFGKAAAGEPDKLGNPTWDLFVSQPERCDGVSQPRQWPSKREVGALAAWIARRHPPAVPAAPTGRRIPRAQRLAERSTRRAMTAEREGDLNDAIHF